MRSAAEIVGAFVAFHVTVLLPSENELVPPPALASTSVPAVNLLERRCDRIHVDAGLSEFHVVPDRTRPMDYEVYDLSSVTGHGSGLESRRRFVPLYAAFHSEAQGHDAYYALQREPRLLSSVQRREGPRRLGRERRGWRLGRSTPPAERLARVRRVQGLRAPRRSTSR